MLQTPNFAQLQPPTPTFQPTSCLHRTESAKRLELGRKLARCKRDFRLHLNALTLALHQHQKHGAGIIQEKPNDNFQCYLSHRAPVS